MPRPMRQHTSAYVSIRRQHTPAYVSIRQHTSPNRGAGSTLRPRLASACRVIAVDCSVCACGGRRNSAPAMCVNIAASARDSRAYVLRSRAQSRASKSPALHASAYVSIRQHTSAYVSVCERQPRIRIEEQCASKSPPLQARTESASASSTGHVTNRRSAQAI